MNQFSSIEQIKQRNFDVGNHFFDPDTMRCFGTRLFDVIHLGHYFITADDQYDASLPKRFTIRNAQEDGSIDTVGEFGEFETFDQALKAMRLIKDNENGDPDFPANPHDYSFDLLFEIEEIDYNPSKIMTNGICEDLGIIIDHEEEEIFTDGSRQRKRFNDITIICHGYSMKIPQFTGPIETELDAYTLFSALEKSDPGSLENFCSDFDYNLALEVYQSWQAYNEDTMEDLSYDEYCSEFGYKGPNIKDLYDAVVVEYLAYDTFIHEAFSDYPKIIAFFDLIS